jgi:hypothetical protein
MCVFKVIDSSDILLAIILNTMAFKEDNASKINGT